MIVSQAKQVAREWVLQEATRIPGFSGAFYHGSVNWLTEDAIFPATSDLDVMIVLTTMDRPSPGKFLHQGLLLEVSYLGIDAIGSVEQVLGNYHLAGSFHRPGIIADPSGHLAMLQAGVSKQYAESHWVRQRCRHARDNALQFLERLNETDPLHDQVSNWLFARGVMAHLPLVAVLRNPTVRRRYVDARKVLLAWQLPALYEELLDLSGFALLSVADVERHLGILAEAYDVACSIIKTPYRFGADISPVSRPVVIDGSRALIDAGYHREAMFWIVATHCRCQHVLCCDAPPEIRDRYAKGFRQLLEELDIRSFRDRERGNEKAREFVPIIAGIADARYYNKRLK